MLLVHELLEGLQVAILEGLTRFLRHPGPGQRSNRRRDGQTSRNRHWFPLVSRSGLPDASVIDKYGGTTGPEIFTIEGMVCTDREHTASLPNRLAPVNALPM